MFCFNVKKLTITKPCINCYVFFHGCNDIFGLWSRLELSFKSLKWAHWTSQWAKFRKKCHLGEIVTIAKKDKNNTIAPLWHWHTPHTLHMSHFAWQPLLHLSTKSLVHYLPIFSKVCRCTYRRDSFLDY